jgi:hypothetical protein
VEKFNEYGGKSQFCTGGDTKEQHGGDARDKDAARLMTRAQRTSTY